MTAALDELHKKIKLFDSLVKRGEKASLSEAQTRLDYIDALLRALGWDVGNTRSLNQFEREVIVEEPVEDDEAARTSFPDYTFQSRGRRLFFLEAKKPSVNVHESIAAALQVRRYVWSAQLPAGVLTDFEEISLYDGRAAPRSSDNARYARSFYRRYDQYLDDWDFISERLSREAVLGGSLLEFGRAESVPDVAREPFDEAFLSDLDRWRLLLGTAIYQNNEIDEAALNEITQLLLDRIIFLRVAEARGIQPVRAPSLLSLTERPGIYPRLLAEFRSADERYNSGLFHFRSELGRHGNIDTISAGLTIPDAPLKSIIAGVYPPVGPYAFSTVPSDLLGSVYERFLSKTLTIGSRRRIELELKPELRKQGGVFYTPPRIVRYMVAKSIGGWIANHKADDVRRIRICDPACGSGAFLVAAFEFLCNEHVRRYLRRKDTTDRYLNKHPGEIYTLKGPEKKRILTDCIFGIDIDSAAVEITKLSLLLATLEGDTREDVDRQLSLFAERALPDLSGNILCNNSLLSPDDLGIADHAAIEALKPLDWERNSTTSPGFDVLIGNPPYVFGEWHHPIQLRVLRQRMAGIKQVDLYHAFLDMVMRSRRKGGCWSLIVPDPVLARDDTAVLRREMLRRGDLAVSHVGAVFADAAVSCAVITQTDAKHGTLTFEAPPDQFGMTTLVSEIPFSTLELFDDAGFRHALEPAKAALLEKIARRPVKLRALVASISRGEEFGKRGMSKTPGHGLVPCIVGEDIQPFQLGDPGHYIPRAHVSKKVMNYDAGKAVTIKTGMSPKTAIDRVGHVTLQSVYNLLPRADVPIEFVAAILNSKVITWYIATMYTSHKNLFPQMNQGHIENLPAPDRSHEADIVQAVRLLEHETHQGTRDFLIQKIEGLIEDSYGLKRAEVELLT